jgi:hypothetical protein
MFSLRFTGESTDEPETALDDCEARSGTEPAKDKPIVPTLPERVHGTSIVACPNATGSNRVSPTTCSCTRARQHARAQNPARGVSSVNW